MMRFNWAERSLRLCKLPGLTEVVESVIVSFID